MAFVFSVLIVVVDVFNSEKWGGMFIISVVAINLLTSFITTSGGEGVYKEFGQATHSNDDACD
ncbi:hypothetical protein [uncultured Pantoea sp.]|uniref:hypothetical protein n=1 Tax=uncultured Pantoea sp. TaxID=218084 RepID=UPI0025DE34F1|nr:hypothetical protein [uncultured Pantoea sp.]